MHTKLNMTINRFRKEDEYVRLETSFKTSGIKKLTKRFMLTPNVYVLLCYLPSGTT